MKSIKRLLSGAVLSILLLSSCAPAAVAQEDLAGTQWLLVSLDHEDQIGPRSNQIAVSISFGDDGKIRGDGGCNSYSGKYQSEASTGSISFFEITSTPTTCGDVNQMATEQLYFEAMSSARSYSVTGDILRIFAGEHNLVFLRSGQS